MVQIQTESFKINNQNIVFMLLFHIFAMSGFYSFCARYKGHLLKGEQNRIIYLTTRLKYRVDHVIKVRVKRDVPSVLSSCFF